MAAPAFVPRPPLLRIVLSKADRILLQNLRPAFSVSSQPLVLLPLFCWMSRALGSPRNRAHPGSGHSPRFLGRASFRSPPPRGLEILLPLPAPCSGYRALRSQCTSSDRGPRRENGCAYPTDL